MQRSAACPRWAVLTAVAAVGALLLAAGSPALGSAPDPDNSTVEQRTTTVDAAPEPVDTILDTVPPTTEEVEVANDTVVDTQPVEADGASSSLPARESAAPSVRDSNIPTSSILIALSILVAVVVAAAAIARRERANGTGPTDAGSAEPDSRRRGTPSGDTSLASDLETLDFLVELGGALLDASDAVGHVESTVRGIAARNGIDDLGVLVLPSSLVLSLRRGDSVVTEVSASNTVPLRLDQIQDVLQLVHRAELGDVSVAEARRELSRVRASGRSHPAPLLLAAYMISTVGLALIMRGGWLEMAVAAVLGLIIGGLRLSTESQQSSYQVFWPLIAATAVSTAVFTTARILPDLVVSPPLAAPLVVFLPGVLLTVGVLELSTGQIVSGASKLAAGAMKLVLLALGIVAGAQLVGVPGGTEVGSQWSSFAALGPWVGVALFGAGSAWFHGARRHSLGWILVVLYVAYAGQVIGGLFFGSALSSFFGALAMTPAALYASRQRFGPTPLVTFLPGFWLLVPGALGLEGVTRALGYGTANAGATLATTLTSMVGIALGLLVGLIVSGADPTRPWSATWSPRRWRSDRVR